MSSKRAIRRKACKGKTRYGSAKDATVAIRNLHRAKGPQGFMTPYKCQFCGAWHFGHPPKNVRQSIAAKRNQPKAKKL